MANSNTEKEGEKIVSSSKNNDLDSLKRRMDEQQRKIESIWSLVSDKTRVEQILEENDSLKRRAAENEGMLKVVKDRLTEKASLLKALDEKNRILEQEVDSYKKQVFSLNNKIGAIESRVFSTNEQNQKLLYELLKHKERLKETESSLAEKDMLVESQTAELQRMLGSMRKDEDEKKVIMLKNHSRKIAALGAAVDSLKTKILQQNSIIEEKTRKEAELMNEFNSKMSDIISSKKSVSFDVSSIGNIPADDLVENSPVADNATKKEKTDRFKLPSPEELFGPDPNAPSKAEEILPMIELALDHGDSVDKVKRSLASSGYSARDIEEAFSKMSIIKQE